MFTLSDRYRPQKIVFLLLFIAGLICFGEIQGPKQTPGFREFKKNPELFLNKEIALGGKVANIDREAFQIKQTLDGEKEIIKLSGSLTKAKVGDNISLVARYQENQLILERYHISNTRSIKLVFSLIGLLWVFLLFMQGFSFNIKKFMFQPKE